MIRIDSLWLAVEPMDMRAGPERLLSSVVQVFGSARAHHGYVFANARTTRIKLRVHDGFGVWCRQSIAAAARSLWVVEQTLFNWVKTKRQGEVQGANIRWLVRAIARLSLGGFTPSRL